MSTTYLPSVSTGVFGSYVLKSGPFETDTKDAEDATVVTTTAVSNNNNTQVAQQQQPHTYSPSISTGIFGSYVLKNTVSTQQQQTQQIFEYRPSNSSGVFGSYTVKTTINSSTQQQTREPIPEYLETSDDWIPGPGYQVVQESKKNAKSATAYGVRILGEWNFGAKNTTNNTNNPKFYVCNGSVVNFSGECIVNAANEGCLGGGGVDGAITSAGGYKLDELRRLLPVIPKTYMKRCRTGSAVITGSGYGVGSCRLRCKYVMHAVGPSYGRSAESMQEGDKLLYDSYAACMKLGEKHKIDTIGFCLISAGIFRGSQSLDTVLEIGCQAIYDNIYDECKEIYMIGYTPIEMNTLLNVTPKVFGKPIVVYGNKRSQASQLSFNTAKGFGGKLWSKFGFTKK